MSETKKAHNAKIHSLEEEKICFSLLRVQGLLDRARLTGWMRVTAHLYTVELGYNVIKGT
jgi:hypothetical protein